MNNPVNAPSSAPLCQPRALLALHGVHSGPPTETVTAAVLPPYLRFKVHPALWTIGQTSFRGKHVTNLIYKHRTAEILLVRRYESWVGDTF